MLIYLVAAGCGATRYARGLRLFFGAATGCGSTAALHDMPAGCGYSLEPQQAAALLRRYTICPRAVAILWRRSRLRLYCGATAILWSRSRLRLFFGNAAGCGSTTALRLFFGAAACCGYLWRRSRLRLYSLTRKNPTPDACESGVG